MIKLTLKNHNSCACMQNIFHIYSFINYTEYITVSSLFIIYLKYMEHSYNRLFLPSSIQFRSRSSESSLRHLLWNSCHKADQSFVNVLEHNFLHWLLDARWQQCHLAESIPTLSIVETSTDGETLYSFRKHCHNWL